MSLGSLSQSGVWVLPAVFSVPLLISGVVAVCCLGVCLVRLWASSIDWGAALRGSSLRLVVRYAEFRSHGLGFVVRRVVLTPDRRTALYGRWSFVGVFGVLVALSSLFLTVSLQSSTRVLSGARAQFAAAVVGLVSAGLIGVVFLIERGESEIYHGRALADRYAEMGVFPLFYTLVGLAVVCVYLALVPQGGLWVDALVLASGLLAVGALLVLFVAIVADLTVESPSAYVFDQLVRSAVRDAVLQHRHEIATDLLAERVPESVTYTTDPGPDLSIFTQPSVLTDTDVGVTTAGLGDVDLVAFEDAATTLAAVCAEVDGTPTLAVATDSSDVENTVRVDLPDGVSPTETTEFQSKLEDAITGSDERVWDDAQAGYRERLDVFRQTAIAAARDGDAEAVDTYLDEYRRVADDVLTADLPEDVVVPERVHRRLCSDLIDVFRAAPAERPEIQSRVANSVRLLAQTARSQRRRTYDRYVRTLCQFVDETYRASSDPTVRRAVVDGLEQHVELGPSGSIPSRLTSRDFEPLLVMLRRTRRVAVLLARTGEFERSESLLRATNQLRNTLDMHATDDGTVPNSNTVFTSDPAAPSLDAPGASLAVIFRDALDAIRFEVLAATYAAVRDPAIETPDAWEEVSTRDSLPTGAVELSHAFECWQGSLRGQGSDVDPGDVAGPARETLEVWNEDRGDIVGEAFGALVLYDAAGESPRGSLQVAPPVEFTTLHETCRRLLQDGVCADFGRSVSWETLDSALAPFARAADLGRLDDETSADVVLDRFRDDFRARFGFRRWLDEQGRLRRRDALDAATTATRTWSLDGDGVEYASDGYPGVVADHRLRALQSDVLTAWLGDIRQQGGLETRPVEHPSALYAALRGLVRRYDGALVVLRDPECPRFESAEQALVETDETAQWPSTVLQCRHESATIPVFEHALSVDAVVVPVDSLVVTEPATTDRVPSLTLDRLSSTDGTASVSFSATYRTTAYVEDGTLVAFRLP